MKILSLFQVLLVCLVSACIDPDEPGALVPKTVVEDPSLPRVELNGALFHAETYGDPANPVVVVLHGGPGNDYRSLLPLQALAADGYFVVFWDQRGTGLSERFPASAYSMDVIIEDLKQVIDYFTGGKNPVVFIGHSWGAMYATLFINRYGTYDDRIKGAVLSEPGAFTKKQLDAFIKRLKGGMNYLDDNFNDALWLRQVVTPAEHARADYNRLTQAAMGFPSVHEDPNKPKPWFRSGAVASAAMLELVKKDFDWTTNLASFTPRVLFLRGDLNESTRLEDQQEMAASYPAAEIVMMRNVGHEMSWERPDEYLEHVRTYFKSIGF